jgi:hypothetical protein
MHDPIHQHRSMHDPIHQHYLMIGFSTSELKTTNNNRHSSRWKNDRSLKSSSLRHGDAMRSTRRSSRPLLRQRDAPV